VSDVIEGRVVHQKSNALQQTFADGPGEPFAVAVQGGADGKGSKLSVLFGFKNGGVGTHLLTYQDGSAVHVRSGSGAPTEIARPDGVTIATIERGDTSVARASGGTEIVRFVGHPDGVAVDDAYRLAMLAPDGSDLGRLDVIRRTGGWALASDLTNEVIWWGQAGQPLKVPILGTRLELTRPLTDTERDTVLGACVDMAIGLRPYVKQMR
jgi:hypothetical protein